MTVLVGIEMSCFWYRDVLIFFSVPRSFFNLQCTGCRGPKHARVHPRKKTISMLNNRRQNLDTKKRSRYQKGDLGHLDTTKKTSRYQKKMHPKIEACTKLLYSPKSGGNALQPRNFKDRMFINTFVDKQAGACCAVGKINPRIAFFSETPCRPISIDVRYARS